MNVAGLVFYSVFLLLTLVWVIALVQAGRTTHAAYRKANSNKGMIMVMLVLTGWFGSLYWFGVMRRRLKA